MVGRLLIIVDTSYWLELFKVPGHSNEFNHDNVKNKFEWATEQKSSFFWPLPCLYEFCNHVAQVKDGHKRIKLAQKLSKTVSQELSEKVKVITVTPACSIEQLPTFLEDFANNHVKETLGCVDAFVIHEAQRLKKNHPNSPVYIWTLDSALKSHEPDTEPEPFTHEI